MIAEHGVSTLFTAPTAFRAIRQQDPGGRARSAATTSRSFRALFLAGERCDPETLRWAEEKLGVPGDRPLVADRDRLADRGQLPRASSELPVEPGSPTAAVPGWDVRVLDGDGEELPSGRDRRARGQAADAAGHLADALERRRAVPRGLPVAFPGYYQTADAGYIDEDGYVFVMARTDDIINVAGHRLSTGAIEEVLAAHPDVAECAVIGVADELKGQLPVGFLVLKAGVDRPHDDIVAEVVQLVRERIGPVAVVQGRRRRRPPAEDAVGQDPARDDAPDRGRQEYTVPATIEDPAMLEEMEHALRQIGYARSGASSVRR